MSDQLQGTLPGFTAESSLDGAAGDPFTALPTQRARSAVAAPVTAALIVSEPIGASSCARTGGTASRWASAR